MKKILQYLGERPQWMIIAVAALLLLGIDCVDFITGPRVSVFLLYLAPVTLVTWFCGKRAGYWSALPCAISRLLVLIYADVSEPGSIVPYWNSFMAYATLLVVARLVHARKELGMRIENLVNERTVSLQAELLQRQRAEEAIHNLASQLSVAEDAERRKLAHDIHDTLGQTLTVIKMNLEAVAEAGHDQSQVKRIRDSLGLVENLIQQTRTLTFELYPAMLDHLGLVPTIRRYSEQFQTQTGVQLTVSELGEPRTLSNQAANYLFRSIKELINNATKHGKAQEVLITVHWRPDAFSIVVDDDGCGFDPVAALSPKAHPGLGLAGIQERLRSLGGELCVESAPGEGARIILELKLDRNHAQERMEIT